MHANTRIKKTLKNLDALYNGTSSEEKKIYYSKLAILELCGWIEESFDEIIKTYSQKRLQLNSNKKWVEENILSNNYGFKYKKNIRKMLINFIGIINIEKFETEFDSTGELMVLDSLLDTLTKERNGLAHTFIKGITTRYTTPSVTLNRFNTLSLLIKNFNKKIKKYCK